MSISLCIIRPSIIHLVNQFWKVPIVLQAGSWVMSYSELGVAQRKLFVRCIFGRWIPCFHATFLVTKVVEDVWMLKSVRYI